MKLSGLSCHVPSTDSMLETVAALLRGVGCVVVALNNNNHNK